MAASDPNDPKTYGLNLPTTMVIAAFCGIAWVNTIELQFRIWLRFKRYKGLYFWSLVLSSLGCAFHALGFLFLDFLIIRQANAVGLIIGISWWCMVTGQALVLYSRLHLVERDKRKVRWVLIMIIINFCVLHLPIMVVSQAVSHFTTQSPHNTVSIVAPVQSTPRALCPNPAGEPSQVSLRHLASARATTII